MLWLYRYICGYLKIIIKGEFNENILNICAVNSITLWNSKLVKKDIETCILIKDFKRLRTLMRKSGIRIHIVKKYGLPFKIYSNRNRAGLLAGICILLITLKFLSGYIWVIDVVGNKTVNEREILKGLKEIGVTEGIKSSSINPKTYREHLLLKCDNLAWAALNIEGSRLTVNVTEIDPTKPTNTPTNLKAKADGIITKIDVTTGNCVVKVGDTVKTGDLLVSGIIEGLNETAFTKSLGSVYAETVREYKLKKDFEQTLTHSTGEMKTKKVLELFSLKIPLYLGKETKEYKSSTNVKNIKLFGKTLPIKIYSKHFSFNQKEKITFTKEQLYEQLEKNLYEKAEKDGVKDFTVISKNYIENEKGITLEVLIKSKENIAISEEILNQSAE